MLLVDTGPLVAYLNRNDPHHAACTGMLEARTDELVVTPYVLTEACYLIGKYVGADAEVNLVDAVVAEDLSQAEVRTTDLGRAAELMRQYRGFPLGIADASLVAVAERLGLTEIATLDRRHFSAITPRHASSFTPEAAEEHVQGSAGVKRGRTVCPGGATLDTRSRVNRHTPRQRA